MNAKAVAKKKTGSVTFIVSAVVNNRQQLDELVSLMQDVREYYEKQRAGGDYIVHIVDAAGGGYAANGVRVILKDWLARFTRSNAFAQEGGA